MSNFRKETFIKRFEHLHKALIDMPHQDAGAIMWRAIASFIDDKFIELEKRLGLIKKSNKRTKKDKKEHERK